MSESAEARILRNVFEGLVAHRETNLKTLVDSARRCSQILNDLAASAAFNRVDGVRTSDMLVRKLPEIASVFDHLNSLAASIKEAEVVIGNIEGLSRGALKFFDKPPVVKKTTNVEKLQSTQRNATPLSQRGPTSTRTDQRADNPGRERQRKRKESSDNQ